MTDERSADALYRDPESASPIHLSKERWRTEGGREGPVLSAHGFRIPMLLPATALEATPEGMYDTSAAAELYRNFLNWLFATFQQDEETFRHGLVARLRPRPGHRVLITGCGLGDDVAPIADAVGSGGAVYASDVAPAMVLAAAEALSALPDYKREAIHLSVADATQLPFADEEFDAAFHFGGINLFGNPTLGVQEMARVVKDGGRVVFGDEGLAPWLKGTDYGDMVVANNPLWASPDLAPALPVSAVEVTLSWVLGNCFYIIDFTKRIGGPRIDPDVPHLGWRGGTMRTRYEGRIEGIDPTLREELYERARTGNTSVHAILEDAIRRELDRRSAESGGSESNDSI